MNVRFFVLMHLVLSCLCAVSCWASPIYSYKDGDGNVHYVDNQENIPSEFKNQAAAPANLPPLQNDKNGTKALLRAQAKQPSKQHVSDLLEGLDLSADPGQVADTQPNDGQFKDSYGNPVPQEKVRKASAALNFILRWWKIIAVFVLIQVVAFWRLLNRAGMPGWGIFIPIYNLVLLSRLGGCSGWWILMAFIPMVGTLIWSIPVHYGIARNFGRSGTFGVFTVLLPQICIPIMAFTSEPD